MDVFAVLCCFEVELMFYPPCVCKLSVSLRLIAGVKDRKMFVGQKLSVSLGCDGVKTLISSWAGHCGLPLLVRVISEPCNISATFIHTNPSESEPQKV